MKSKVFGIGMYKTGTTSLGRALDILGYKTLHGPWMQNQLADFDDGEYYDQKKWEHSWEIIKKQTEMYSGFQDYPWMFIFEKCYEWYPDAKFVMTTRDAIDRANSDANMWNTPLEQLKSSGKYQEFIDLSYLHEEKVDNFFKDKPNLLKFNVFEGDGWDKLCNFLGCNIPKQPYPHMNKGRY